jgi:hypothetical protein
MYVPTPQAAAIRLHLSEIDPHLAQSEIRSMTVECDRVGVTGLAFYQDGARKEFAAGLFSEIGCLLSVARMKSGPH